MKLVCWNCILPLTIGGLLYLVTRTSSLHMFHWAEYLHVGLLVDQLRFACKEALVTHLPSWILFSLPDALWMYAFTAAIILLWERKITGYVLVPLILGLGSEVGQYLKFVPGTFDIVDALCYLFGFLFSIGFLIKSK